MYAIVEIGGKQFKVTQDQFVYAPKMQDEEGASVEFDRVLLMDNDGKVEVGDAVDLADDFGLIHEFERAGNHVECAFFGIALFEQ